MIITINSQVLSQEVRLLARIVPAKSALPILSNIHLRAEDQLYLEATDLQLSMSTACPATITEGGSITIPAKKLLDILEQIPDSDVTFTVERGHVRLVAGSFRSRITSLPPDDFPALPSPEGDISVLPAKMLTTLINRSGYAITDNANQHVLQGALLSLHEKMFALIATDGKRLSIATASYSGGPTASYVIPDRAMAALSAHAETGPEVEFSCNGKHLFFMVGRRLLTSRMMEGKFPAYERIIPRECDKRASIDRTALTAALRRVVLMAEAAQPAVAMVLTAGFLDLAARTAELGEADERMPILYEGADIRFVANGKYVLDFLERCTQKNVTVDMKTEASPMLFTDGPDFINVIMGMR